MLPASGGAGAPDACVLCLSVAYWRFWLCVSVVYELFLIFILFQVSGFSWIIWECGRCHGPGKRKVSEKALPTSPSGALAGSEAVRGALQKGPLWEGCGHRVSAGSLP